MFGFTVHDSGGDEVSVERDGRICHVDLVAIGRVKGSDPRDVWLLSLAIDEGTHWLARETYFYYRIGDGVLMPVQIRLGKDDDGLYVDITMFDGRPNCARVETVEDFEDLLPPLSAPNAIGYHRARNRVWAKCLERRPIVSTNSIA